MLWRNGQAVGSLRLASIYADCCVYLSGLSDRWRDSEDPGGVERRGFGNGVDSKKGDVWERERQGERDRERERETRGGDHCKTHSFTAKDTNKHMRTIEGTS